MVSFFNEDICLTLKNKLTAKSKIKQLITSEGKLCGDINFIFCSNNYLLEINRKYLNHDYYTDVITFDYCEKNIVSGDIYISIEQVQANAAEFGTETANELSRVMYHGIIHLCGYNDKTPEEKTVMDSKENYYLNLLSVIDIKQ